VFNFFRKPRVLPVIADYSCLRRRALIISCVSVDPECWGGWAGKLPGTTKDREKITKLLSDNNFGILRVDDAAATIDNISKEAKRITAGMLPGDLLVVYYTGHGMQVKDTSGDEPDALDEAMCLYDGGLTDDCISNMLRRVPEGVRVLMITDCCHSQTLARSTPPEVKAVMAAAPDLKCQLIHFAGCGDAELSYETPEGGNFTTALVKSFKKGMDYSSWFSAAVLLMPDYQRPYAASYGTSNRFWITPALT